MSRWLTLGEGGPGGERLRSTFLPGWRGREQCTKQTSGGERLTRLPSTLQRRWNSFKGGGERLT